MTRRNPRSRRGMTLLESLVAVLILALLAVTILAGGRTALRIYRQSTFASESRMLTQTINDALRDVLRYTTAVSTDDTGAVTSYTCPTYSVADGCLQVGTGTEAGQIFLDADGGTRLLTTAAYSGLYVQDFSVTCDGEYFTVTYALHDPLNNQTTDAAAFTCRGLNLPAA